MKRKPVKTGIILCPDDPRWDEGEPMYSLVAAILHDVGGKTCALCGKPTAEHSIIIEEGK